MGISAAACRHQQAQIGGDGVESMVAAAGLSTAAAHPASRIPTSVLV
jgi:hypothetical protein